MTDNEILADVRLKFSEVYHRIETAKDPSTTLDAFLADLPAPGKTR